MPPEPSDHPFTPDLFERADESDDLLFYATAQRISVLDRTAVEAVGRFLTDTIPENGTLLDLMSGWRSYLPRELRRKQVVGLGFSAKQMSDNPDLDARVVHDLNRNPELPFPDAKFDGAMLTASMQYLVHPIEVFREVRRVLRPGAPFVVVISLQCFATKAVKIWHRCETMRERMELGMAYFRFAGGFVDLLGADLRPGSVGESDSVAAVIGRRPSEGSLVPPRVKGWRRR